MQVRPNFACMRGLCLRSINNHGRKRILSATLTASTVSTSSIPSTPSTATTTTSTTTTTPIKITTTASRITTEPRPRGRDATDSISIMSAAGSGYADYVVSAPFVNNEIYTAAFDPLAPSFVPLPRSQPPSYSPPMTRRFAPQNAHAATTDSPKPPSPRRGPRDVINPPSSESGGVPNPTPEYLAIASHPPFLLPHPRNLLVVVDLNGTLLHRPRPHNPTRFVERPYARPFLSYCISTFTVVIWSSAQPENVKNMCRQLMTPEDSAKVVAIWGRDSFGLSKADYRQRTQCYKRLTALWNDPVVAASHPMAAAGERWSQLNTVLVDDSMEKARSEPFNLVQLPEFKGNAEEQGFILPQVHDYLNDCSQQANVSAYMKGRPFKTRPDFTL
ncbi:HAD-like domain-containing protein [Nemania serpens]|nr:HAD-like domain-containing protein [Nemania serpens]